MTLYKKGTKLYHVKKKQKRWKIHIVGKNVFTECRTEISRYYAPEKYFWTGIGEETVKELAEKGFLKELI